MKKLCIFVLHIFLVIGLTGCYLLPKEEAVLAPPLVEPPEVSYDVVEVEKGDLEKRINGSGNFVSTHQENIFFKNNSGRIKNLYVGLGDQVQEGDLLAELDTDNLKSQIQQQKIVLQKMELNYEEKKEEIENTYELEKKKIDIQVMQAKLDQLVEEQNRQKQMEGYIAKNDMDSLEEQIEEQKLYLEKSKLDYEQAIRNKETQRELKKAEIDIELAKIQLHDLEAELESATLRATIAGKITYLDYEVTEGTKVEPYQTIMRVANPKELQLQYSGSNTSDFQLGMEVDVKIKKEIFKGKVAMTPREMPYDAPDYMKNMIQIEVQGLPEEVEMGDSAQIALIQDSRKDVITLPRNLIRTYLGRRYVLVLEEGLKKERDVEIGLETPTEVEIIKGLEVGDQVITK